jgi:transcriptional regulator with XRE-family HTH domain
MLRSQTLPDHVTRLLAQVGANIDLARKRRRLTVATLCGRASITPQTYRRLVTGEPGIGIGVIAAVLHGLNLEGDLALLACPASDDHGIMLERARQPKRIAGSISNELDTNF